MIIEKIIEETEEILMSVIDHLELIALHDQMMIISFEDLPEMEAEEVQIDLLKDESAELTHLTTDMIGTDEKT